MTWNPSEKKLNRALDVSWEEWEIPRDTDKTWPEEAKEPPRPVVGAAYRPPEGNERFHRC